MDYTTLIERLLDGTITADEQAELDRLMADSPEVEREVRRLVAVERILRDTSREEEHRSLAFRESVRTGLKASLGLSGAAAATELNAPTPDVPGRRSGTTGKYAAGLLAILLLGVAVVYFLLPDSNDTKQQIAQHTPTPVSPAAPAETNDVPVEQQYSEEPALQTRPQQSAESRVAPEQAAQQPRSAVPVLPVPDEDTAQEKEVSGTVQAPSGREQQYRKLIETSVRKLEEQRATPAVAAVTARQIALLYEKLDETAPARQYFDTARAFARQASVRETEAEITGEYALFEQRRGNTARASALAAEALQIFRSLRSERLHAWEQRLEPLVRQ